MTYRLLIADDNGALLAECTRLMDSGSGIRKDTIATPEGCLAKIRGGTYDAVILDISFSRAGKEGIALIPEIRRLAPDTEILMMSCHDDDETMHLCFQAGAHHFISKQTNTTENLVAFVQDALARKASRTDRFVRGRQLAKGVGAVFASPSMAKAFSRVAAVRESPAVHVLITGPSGAGKEMIAEALARKKQGAPYVKINCARISDTLGDSELFGHEKGSFTSSDRRHIGAFERAMDGDIFLDEIARLSPFAQGQLLRTLQSGEYNRVGGERTLKTTARVIAATNEDLDAMVCAGTFRGDLLQRLRRFAIVLEPLAQRREDIEPLVLATIKRSAKPHLRVEPRVMHALRTYTWPGNARQLEDTVIEAMLFAEGAQITLSDLPGWFLPAKIAEHAAPAPARSYVERCIDRPFAESDRAFKTDVLRATALQQGPSLTLASLSKALDTPPTTLYRMITDLGLSLKSLAGGSPA